MDIQPIGVGYFGNIYDQFRGKVKEAFDFLIIHEDGDLLGVFHREELGDIENWVVTSFDNNRPKSQKKASATTLATPDSNSGGRAVASDAVS
ncbi:MAG: hypothetical protein II887_00110 [Bacteroidales bacterium]|nr:hypothetical protein [Bacteroidales bacterium]